jgi:hypothetical protein
MSALGNRFDGIRNDGRIRAWRSCWTLQRLALGASLTIAAIGRLAASSSHPTSVPRCR